MPTYSVDITMAAANAVLLFNIVAVAGSSALGSLGTEQGLSDLLVTLATIPGDNTELNILSDFSNPLQTRILADISEAGIPVYSYDLKELRQRQKQDFLPDPCPVLGPNTTDPHWFSQPTDSIHVRKQLLPSQNHHRSIFVWTESTPLEEAIEIFDDSVMWCAQRKELGIYHMETRFYFYSGSENETRRIFESENVRKHPNVVGIQRLEGNTPAFGFWSYNFFRGADQPSSTISLKYVWKPGKTITSSKEVFTSLSTFQGRKFRITQMPYAPMILGTYVDNAQDPEHSYRDIWGYDMELLWALQRHLDFTYDIVNPPDFSWGGKSAEDGTWTGVTGQAESGSVDWIIGGLSFSDQMGQVMKPKLFLQRDFLGFAAPPPKQVPKFLALLSPFTLVLWISVIGSIFVCGLLMYGLASFEGYIYKMRVNQFASFLGSIWYCFGTIISESMARNVHHERTNALR